MRPKLLLLALCAVATFGQTATPKFVGLPEYGLTLDGPVRFPTIVNNSGRTVSSYMLWLRDANGVGPSMQVMLTGTLRRANVPPPTGPMAPAEIRRSWPQVGNPSSGPPVEAILDAVVFGDSQFVGPDSLHSFERMSIEIDAERSLAQAVLAGRVSWEQLDAFPREHKGILDFTGDRPTPQAVRAAKEAIIRYDVQRILIQDLLEARAKGGDAAALTIADWSSKLPVVWKAQ